MNFILPTITINIERWKWNRKYRVFVSNRGRVKNIDGKVLKVKTTQTGYLAVRVGIKKAIFIHGCFWHRHQGCRKSSMPCVNVDYWSKKFATTVERDLQNQANLTNLGWSWLIIWECQLKNLKLVQDSIRKFLEDINGW